MKTVLSRKTDFQRFYVTTRCNSSLKIFFCKFNSSLFILESTFIIHQFFTNPNQIFPVIRNVDKGNTISTNTPTNERVTNFRHELIYFLLRNSSNL